MAFRTPAQIEFWLKHNSHRLDNPVQYLGDEPNSYRKSFDDATVRMLTYACWPYEQSAGNQAIPLVYRTANEHKESFMCDRSYLPSTPRDLKVLERSGMPIFGIESKRQMSDFDVVGSSVSYQVLTINFIKQLMMSDIPPTWEDRHDHVNDKTVAGRHRDPEKWPFVICGGQAFGAPELLAPVVDAWFCGEAEDEPGNPGLGAVLERIEAFKLSGRWQSERLECYADLAREFNFLYFPCFIDVHYEYEDRPTVGAVLHDHINPPPGWEPDAELQPSKQVVGYTAKIEGMRLPVVKRFVQDLNSVPGLVNPPLLYVEPGMGTGDLEAQRGCPAWCGFCALTYRAKPYRQKDVPVLIENAKELIRNTGGTHISPFGPDFPMHTQKKLLIRDLLEQVVDDVDASSMRVDDFVADGQFALIAAHGGMRTVTLGVEGNSQRMRDLVGKGAADEDIKEAVVRGINAGITKFKFYMIAFLPGEDEGDIYQLLDLARELANIRTTMGSNALFQFSWTPMLIEANTPFQWFAPTIPNYAIGDVWEELRDLNIQFKLGGKVQRDKLLYFQLAQRASRDIGKAMVEAVCDRHEGSWGGAPRGLYDDIEDSLRYHGFHNGKADAYDERSKHDMFGWEFLDQGINVELMWVTYQQMREFLENTDSATYDENFGDAYHGNEWIQRCDTKCYGKTCGVCKPKDLQIRRNYIEAARDEIDVDLGAIKVIDRRSVAMRVRARVLKDEDKRFVMNDFWRYGLRRAAYRADLPISVRTVRYSSDNITFKEWSCGADFVEFGLTKRMTKEQVAEAIARMNEDMVGMKITDWAIHSNTADLLRQDVDLSLYDMEVEIDRRTAMKAIAEWISADYVKMVIKDKSKRDGIVAEEVNAKDFVESIWFVQDGHHLRMRALIRGKASPYNVYAALFNKPSWIEAAEKPAYRIEAFIDVDPTQIDFFRPACESCGNTIPVNPLDKPYDYHYCPRCKDEQDGILVKELVAA
jgi:radical SAM superfamily enzyme YgiQ (UPF0313 family)